jgi:hypothetical protein
VRRVERLRTVRAVDRAVAILPFPDRLTSDVVEPIQLCLGQRRILDLSPDQACSTGLAVQRLSHRNIGEKSGWCSVRKTCLALKSGQLRMGT